MFLWLPSMHKRITVIGFVFYAAKVGVRTDVRGHRYLLAHLLQHVNMLSLRQQIFENATDHGSPRRRASILLRIAVSTQHKDNRRDTTHHRTLDDVSQSNTILNEGRIGDNTRRKMDVRVYACRSSASGPLQRIELLRHDDEPATKGVHGPIEPSGTVSDWPNGEGISSAK